MNSKKSESKKKDEKVILQPQSNIGMRAQLVATHYTESMVHATSG